MQFDMSAIKSDYESKKGWREVKKWAFAIGTLGFGGLYLWATTSVVKQGQIGLRCNNRGEMILLPPGRHSNFPWENYPVKPQSLADQVVKLGPFQIISVATGYVAKTFNKGVLEILTQGQHLLTEAAHVFTGFVSIKQETKELKAITASTHDNVSLILHADVRYQITDPAKAIQQIVDIEQSITEIARISISQTVGHHNLADFAPATANVGQSQPQGSGTAAIAAEKSQPDGISAVIKELTAQVTQGLEALGIKLLSIGIPSWNINDKDLAHELAQGAVIQSQTQSKMISAKRAAEIKAIETDAEARAIVALGQAKAEAVRLEGEAITNLAEKFKGNPVAQRIYALQQRTALVTCARSPYLFFTDKPDGQLPQFTLPLQEMGCDTARAGL